MHTRRRFVRVGFKPQDCWVGVHWKLDAYDMAVDVADWRFDLWVCVVPMLPVHYGWRMLPRRSGPE